MANVANIGIGFDAFTKGMLNGANLSRQFTDAKNQKEIRDIRKEGLDAARAGYDQDVENSIKPVDFGLPDGVEGPQLKGFEVDGKRYGNEDEARKAAKSSVKSVEDRFYSDAVPRIAEAYAGQGDIEKAEAWRSYAEDRDTKKRFKEWSKNFSAFQRGDLASVGDYFLKSYNDDVNDGVTAKDYELVKDNDGNQTGFNVTLIDDNTGEERKQFVDREYLLTQGFALMSPQGQFEMAYPEMRAAQKEVAKAKIKSQEDALAHERAKELETHKANLKGNEYSEKVTAAKSVLKQYGYSDNEIAEFVPRIMGISDTRQSMNPVDMRVKAEEILAQDYKFRKMSRADKDKLVSELVTSWTGSAPAAGPAGGLPQPSKPLAPGQGVVQPGAGSIPVWRP